VPKPAIPFWAAYEVALAAVSDLEEWREKPAMEAVTWLKNRPWAKRDAAANMGSEIHAIVEKMLGGADYSVEAEVDGYVRAARSWMAECGPEPIWMERTLFNETHLHAGTADLLCRFKAYPELGLTLVDYKTGKGLWPDMAVQVVGGYSLGGEYTLDSDQREIAWSVPKTSAILHLKGDGTYELRPIPHDVAHRRCFLAALEIRRWEASKVGIGDPLPRETSWTLDLIKNRISAMTTEQRLELSALCIEAGIRAPLPNMTDDELEKTFAIIQLYEMRSEEDESKQSV
jgi:hypothetical protein